MLKFMSNSTFALAGVMFFRVFRRIFDSFFFNLLLHKPISIFDATGFLFASFFVFTLSLSHSLLSLLLILGWQMKNLVDSFCESHSHKDYDVNDAFALMSFLFRCSFVYFVFLSFFALFYLGN